MLNAVQTRGLSEETLKRFGVGAGTFDFRDSSDEWVPRVCVVFPMCDSVDGTPVRLKLRGVSSKRDMRLHPGGSFT